MICTIVHTKQYARGCDHRLRRLHRPGDTRPACSPTPSSSRSRSDRTRSPAAAPAPSTRASTGTSRLRPERRGGRAPAPTLLFLCLDHAAAAAFEPPADAVVVDLSAPTACATPSLARRGTAPRPGAWSYGLPELYPPEGRLIANPGCYATAALLALGPARGRDRRTASSTPSRASPAPAARSRHSSHAGAVLENLSPYAVGEHRHAPEIAQALGFPRLLRPAPPAGAPRPARDLLRPTRAATPRARSRTRTRRAPSSASCPRASRPSSGACRARTRPRSASSPTARPDTTIVICAIDNLGKGAAGQAVQNANLALGLRETAGLRLAGCAGSTSHSAAVAARGLRRRRGVAARASAGSERQGPRARPLHRRPRRARRCSPATACRPPRWSSRGASRARRAAGRRRSTPASRTPQPASAASSTRSRRPPRPRGCSRSTPRRCSSSRPA